MPLLPSVTAATRVRTKSFDLAVKCTIQLISSNFQKFTGNLWSQNTFILNEEVQKEPNLLAPGTGETEIPFGTKSDPKKSIRAKAAPELPTCWLCQILGQPSATTGCQYLFTPSEIDGKSDVNETMGKGDISPGMILTIFWLARSWIAKQLMLINALFQSDICVLSWK